MRGGSVTRKPLYPRPNQKAAEGKKSGQKEREATAESGMDGSNTDLMEISQG